MSESQQGGRMRFDTVASIALIMSLLVQTAVVSHWGGRLAAQVEAVNDNLARVEQAGQRQRTQDSLTLAAHEERLRAVENAVIALTERLPPRR